MYEDLEESETGMSTCIMMNNMKEADIVSGNLGQRLVYFPNSLQETDISKKTELGID